MFSLNFMFFCSLIEELCAKEENYKTSCNFNFGHECMLFKSDYVSYWKCCIWSSWFMYTQKNSCKLRSEGKTFSKGILTCLYRPKYNEINLGYSDVQKNFCFNGINILNFSCTESRKRLRKQCVLFIQMAGRVFLVELWVFFPWIVLHFSKLFDTYTVLRRHIHV